MGSDSLLTFVGFLLTLHGSIMVAVYLVRERGSLFDPIPVSWAGYIVFIGIGTMFTGILYPERGTNEAKSYAMFLYFLATIMYTVGLYAGKSRILRRMIPVPKPTLGAGQALLMWTICAILFAASFSSLAFPSIGIGIAKILGAIVNSSIGTLTLVSILVILAYKGRYGIKLLMTVTLIVMLAFILKFYFSRRPLLAVFVAAVSLFYYLKISWRPRLVKAFFVTGIIAGGIMLLLYLGASRGARVREFYTGPQRAIFSKKNWENLLGGVTINTRVYEYTIQQFSGDEKLLYGRGIAPAFVFWIPRAFWEGKPLPTGGVVSRMWFNVPEHKVSVVPTLPGELYANFGFLGVVIGMFFVGKVVRAINDYMVSIPDNLVVHLAWFIIIPDFAAEWRGDFTSMTVQGFMRVAVFFFLTWAAGKFMGADRVQLGSDMEPFEGLDCSGNDNYGTGPTVGVEGPDWRC